MPAILRFPKEEISAVAFDLVAEGGLESLSANNVARKLHSSVKPIYTHFQSMDNLKRSVAVRIVSRMKTYIFFDYGEEFKLLNVAIGQTLFAYDNKKLYLALFGEQNPLFSDILGDVVIETFNYFKDDQLLDEMSYEGLLNLYQQISNFMYGLNMAICNGWFEPEKFGLKEILSFVKQMGEVIYKGIVVEKIPCTNYHMDTDNFSFDSKSVQVNENAVLVQNEAV